MKTTHIKTLFITAASILCLGASAIAGPAPKPMYAMINGGMYEITAFTGDVTLESGCKICMDGKLISPKGKVTKLHDGDVVSATGVKMSPTALHSHGG